MSAENATVVKQKVERKIGFIDTASFPQAQTYPNMRPRAMFCELRGVNTGFVQRYDFTMNGRGALRQ